MILAVCAKDWSHSSCLVYCKELSKKYSLIYVKDLQRINFDKCPYRSANNENIYLDYIGIELPSITDLDLNFQYFKSNFLEDVLNCDYVLDKSTVENSVVIIDV